MLRRQKFQTELFTLMDRYFLRTFCLWVCSKHRSGGGGGGRKRKKQEKQEIQDSKRFDNNGPTIRLVLRRTVGGLLQFLLPREGHSGRVALYTSLNLSFENAFIF